MLRYIAFVWNGGDPASCDTAKTLARHYSRPKSGWCDTFNQPGLRILLAKSPSDMAGGIPLYGGAGMIVGRIFETRRSAFGFHCRPESLNEEVSKAVIKSGGRHLISSYWGSYVAFLRDSESGFKWVLKAPTGSLPCFRLRFREVDIFFSRMEDCLTLGLSHSFNWSYISAHVVLGSLISRKTAMDGVFEVKYGECCAIQGQKLSTTLYWNPGELSRCNPIDELETAACLVHETAQACAQTLAMVYPTGSLLLSGGLDSTIVAACLRHAPSIACVNCYTDGSDSDERHFARLAAERAGLPLIELQRPSDVSLAHALNANRTAIIYDFTLRLEFALTIDLLNRVRNVTAIFTGNGGDEIFQRASASLAPTALDFLRLKGLRPQMAKIMLSDALLNRSSIWKIAAQMATRLLADADSLDRLYLAGSLSHKYKAGLVNRDLIASLENNPHVVHPWLPMLDRIPPGKLYQIMAFSGRGYDNPFANADSPEIVDPLLSQPLVEVCLRIPTYIHSSKGVSRAVARKAFVNVIPQEISERATKGGANEYHKRMLMSNIDFVRDILLNGVLVREKLLNRPQLEDALSGKPTKSAAYTVDITALFSTELWIQLWGRQQERAAA
jgi:asparagine synthase (glutamine-hydrolysing)